MIVVVVAAFAGSNVCKSQRTVAVSNLVLANVEALANDEKEERLYDTKRREEIEIWDDETGTYQKISVTICEGKGCLSC